jgi:hypothetical protein
MPSGLFLLVMGGFSVNITSAGRPPSRAGSLLQWFYGGFGTAITIAFA